MSKLTPEEKTMLEELLGFSLEKEDSRIDEKAFQQMLDRGLALTEKQAKWVRGVYDRVFDSPSYENLFSAGKVPLGKPVETPAVLRNLPKKPPSRPPGAP
jgi:hypothetical protein